MLITFKTSSWADITMFGDAAVELLKLMGMSGNVPGALMAEDIPAALASLKERLSQREEAEGNVHVVDEEEEGEVPVPLNHRAVPLIALLEAAAEAGDSVIWEEGD
ncbi:MAG: hypothetical protein CSB44_11040 [Gammaproteobacteria bacterium]|nr:MAG: hypothetical protein CSB44_11040 [Gammaproteobacteria bacterium]PIE37095.1 MAG: hypothetical protein CSA54_02125 [Gammaproteobacteria bacterium]